MPNLFQLCEGGETAPSHPLNPPLVMFSFSNNYCSCCSAVIQKDEAIITSLLASDHRLNNVPDEGLCPKRLIIIFKDICFIYFQYLRVYSKKGPPPIGVMNHEFTVQIFKIHAFMQKNFGIHVHV